MRMEGISIGEAIKELRKIQNVSKEQLAEKAGISVSHLEKIEAGSRNPGINTYQKLLNLLNADMVIHKQIETVQEKCAAKAQEILLGSTEPQAVFMVRMLEAMVQNIDLMTQGKTDG